jgi:hypothetical protein
MYCQNCGAHITAEQNFCRACGTNLRTLSESFPGYSPTWSAPRGRWQIIIDAVTDALRSGFHYVFQPSTAGLESESQTSRFKRLGFIAFWAGLAALMGDFMGVVLILTGIGLMAYARGFFGPVREAPPVRTPEFQAPPSRETSYSGSSSRPSAVEGERSDR